MEIPSGVVLCKQHVSRGSVFRVLGLGYLFPCGSGEQSSGSGIYKSTVKVGKDLRAREPIATCIKAASAQGEAYRIKNGFNVASAHGNTG